MSESQQGADATPTSPSVAGLRVTLLRAAWLAILLGFVMEILLLLFAAGLGIFPGLEFAAADLVKQVSWSTFVCVGLALGTAVSNARAPLMGLLGLIAVPLAFVISRGLHQAHVAAGLAAGILFGGTIVGLTYQMSPETPATTALLSQGVNEILFPVGCSLVLFAATALGKRVQD